MSIITQKSVVDSRVICINIENIIIFIKIVILNSKKKEL